MAAISHDLRTPLTRIRMRLEASEDDPLTARSIADIQEMDDLIESALEVFRGASTHDEPAARAARCRWPSGPRAGCARRSR